MNNARTVALGLTMAVLAAPNFAKADWPTYTVYAVPLINNHQNEVHAVNNFLRVGGTTEVAQVGADTGLIGGANLPSQKVSCPPGWDFMDLNGVNDDQFYVGSTHIGSTRRAMLYHPGDPLKLLIDPIGIDNYHGSQAFAINHWGTILGYYTRITVESDNREHTYMYTYDRKLGLRTGFWPDTYPGGINEDGLVACAPGSPYVNHKAQLLLTPGMFLGSVHDAPKEYTGLWPTGVSTVGGTVVVGSATTTKVNASKSDIMGWVFIKSSNQWLFMPDPFGKNYETDPLAVDYWGQRAVGYSIDDVGFHRATVWERPTDHKTWIPHRVYDIVGQPNDWTFYEATSITPQGVIAGTGYHEGKRCGFVAVPTDLFSFTLDQTQIVGGNSMFGHLKTAIGNPFDLHYDGLTSKTIVSIPGRIPMPALKKLHDFSVQTMGVDAPTSVELAVGMAGVRRTRFVTVLPSVMKSLAFTPDHISANSKGTATIKFNGMIGPSGRTIQISCADGSVRVPETVRAAAGATSVSFDVYVGDVRKKHLVDIVAGQGDGSVRASVLVG